MLLQPGTTAVVLLTLALGIGANTAIFSAVDPILRPLPYKDPDQLVLVWEKRPSRGLQQRRRACRLPRLVAHEHGVRGYAAMMPTTADVTGRGEPVRLSAGRLDCVLRPPGRAAGGRRFFRADEAARRIVSWCSATGCSSVDSAAILGRRHVAALLNGVTHEIIGALPASFEYTDSKIELWVPLPEGGTQPPTRSNHFLTVYARMKPGVTLEQARAEMDRIGADLSRQYPDTNARHGAAVVPMRDEVTSPVRTGLPLLFGAVGFVLLIACVNVANLLLARATARRREVAIRAARGAGRGRLARQALTESLFLGILGGAAGLLVAVWGVDILRLLAPVNAPILGLERVGVDTRVLIFSIGLSLLTGVLFGLLPAWQVASQDLNDALKEGGRSPAGVRRRLRLALVVSEIALASLLLVGAGLTLRSFQMVLRSEAGFRSEGVLTAFIALPGARYRDEAKTVATFEQIEQRFRSIAGVRVVGGTTALPLSGQDGRRGISVEGFEATDAPTRAHPRAISPDYFRAMGIQLTAGRAFTPADRADAPPVAIVNETMARRYWPGTTPIGKRVQLVGTPQWREVVGIVRDVRHWGLERTVNPELYMPLPQMVYGFQTYALATDADPSSVAAAVREELRAVDPDLPVSSVRTMEEVAAASVAARRAGLVLLSTFGALALVLAAAGIYGVMAHLVTLRTAEIGVRMTMGARPSDVLRLVLKEGLVQAALGLAIGVGAAVLVMQSFRTLLYEVSPGDPVTLAGVTTVLVVTVLLACLVPARRAMRVDPVAALK